MVCDSSGKPRADTGGGATRRLFMQLPGVGAKTAKIWYDLGFRCVSHSSIASWSVGVHRKHMGQKGEKTLLVLWALCTQDIY